MKDKNIIALKNTFLAEFENLRIDSVKKQYLLERAFNENAFYTFLPIEILSLCKDRDKYIKATMELSVYSFLYLSSVLYFDKLSDGQVAGNEKNAIIYLYEIKEYAVRGFCKLFGCNSCFWKQFQELKCKMFNIACKKDYDTEDALIEGLGNKSILVHCYVVAMQIITREDIDWERINKALDIFHKGFQLLDDYEDFKEDYKNNQLNYYISRLKSYNELTHKVFLYINKFLYVSGIAQSGLQKSMQYMEEAYDLFVSLGMDTQAKIILVGINEIKRKLFYIQNLLLKAEMKKQQSNELVCYNNLDNAINNSLSFLLKNMNEDFSWEDFMTSGGIGKNWVTGFVISMLGECHPLLHEINNACIALYKKGGKYNESLIYDADSINFLLKSMQILKMDISKDDIAIWLKFQHSDGGFSTYIGNQIKDVMHYPDNADFGGWLSSQNCVTAVACWIAKSLKMNDIYRRSYLYLEKQVKIDGSIQSYWWSDDIYATAFAVLCDISDKTVQYLIGRQEDTGAWTNMGAASPFYTALALKALIYIYEKESDIHLLSPIEKGVKWLLSQQFTDGSWKSEKILRIPAPDIIQPNDVNKWYFTSFGVNIITDDFTRVFTTSLIHNVLYCYGKSI